MFHAIPRQLPEPKSYNICWGSYCFLLVKGSNLPLELRMGKRTIESILPDPFSASAGTLPTNLVLPPSHPTESMLCAHILKSSFLMTWELDSPPGYLSTWYYYPCFSEETPGSGGHLTGSRSYQVNKEWSKAWTYLDSPQPNFNSLFAPWVESQWELMCLKSMSSRYVQTPNLSGCQAQLLLYSLVYVKAWGRICCDNWLSFGT